MKGDFQSTVNTAQAPAVEGDFASKNPRYFYLAGPGGCVVGPAGVLIGRFAWATAPLDGDDTPATVTNSGFGPPAGIIHREQQGMITTYLTPAGMFVPQGFEIAITTSADFWIMNRGTTEAVPGQKCYAAFADGSASFNDAGTPSGGGTSTASTIAPATATFTAAIADNVMTVTGSVTGTIYPGSTLSGAGVPSDTIITQQLAGGTPGGDGTYLLSVGELALPAVSATASYGLLTLGGTVAGLFVVGQTVTGTNVATAGTSIIALITGTGGVSGNTLAVNKSQTAASGAINSALNIETGWFARSGGLPNELVKISRQVLG